MSLYNIFFNDFLFNLEDILGANMDPVNKPYPNLPMPIDKKRIKITEPLEGSMSAFIIIKTDNAKVPTENNIKPIIPLNTFIIQDYQILNVESNPSKDYRLMLQVPGLLVLRAFKALYKLLI